MTRSIRFLRPRDLAALALLLHGCVPAEPTGEVEQAETVPGTVSQGTVSQGTVSQGTVSQGSQNAVWGFRYTDWWNSGMRLKDTGVFEGHLVATWDRTEDCGTPELGGPTPLARSCGWYGAGWATCIPGTTVTVGAGACGLGRSSTDSMIRVCKGDKPCPAAAALAANDDTAAGPGCSPSNRPAASFTCPATSLGMTSRFFVMVSPKSGEPLFSYAVAAGGTTTLPPSFETKLADRPCSKCGSQFVGTTLGGLSGTGQDPVTYRIAAVKVEDASTSFYTLRQKVDDTPLCLDASPPLRDERAVPMPGRWGANGRFVNTPDSFTFACTAGVIAKCYVHGYRPWGYNADGESLRDYHQTCTRAMRADYCGDGGSHTVTGTMIDLYDRRAHAAQDTTWDRPLEAIWRRDLATLEPPVVPRGPVACLAKKRWETIPLGDCAELTPDPRMDDKKADYCDRYPIQGGWFSDDLSNPHLIANKSAFIDAGLWRWRRLDGQELRSTTTLPTTEPQLLDPAYLFSPSLHEPVLIGSVYALETSDGVRPQHTIKLSSYLHRTTKDYLTTTDPAPPGYDPAIEEGWILAPSCATIPGCPTTKPLGLYRNAATGDSATDTSAPTGYQLVKVLGYLPR